MRGFQIRCDDTGGEAILGRVGACDHLVFGVKTQNAHHRPENFFAHNAHVVAAVGEYGRRDACAVLPCGFYGIAAAQQARAVLHTAADVVQHLIAVGKSDHGAEIGGRIERIAHANARDAGDDGVLECRLEGVVHKHPRAVGTHLAAAVKIRHHRNVRCQLDVRVGTDDERRFAAQLHGYVFQARLRRLRHDVLAGWHAAGERYFGNVGVGAQLLSDARVAQNDVEYAVRQARFGENFRQFQGRERR